MTDERTPAPDDLGYLLHRAARLFRAALAARLRDMGLTPLQAAALIALSSAGPMTAGRLAEAIGADAPTTTGVVQRLERDGWVTVTRSARDARARVVELAPRAAEALPSVLASAEAASADGARVLSADDRAKLAELLGKLLEGER